MKTKNLLKIFLTILFVFATSFAFGQEAHVLFNRLNMGVYNPAFTGVNGSFISLSNRSQWASVADAPQTGLKSISTIKCDEPIACYIQNVP